MKRARSRRTFTNTDRTVFALTNLPETVKGALFARYSRSGQVAAPAVPRQFLGQVQSAAPVEGRGVGTERRRQAVREGA